MSSHTPERHPLSIARAPGAGQYFPDTPASPDLRTPPMEGHSTLPDSSPRDETVGEELDEDKPDDHPYRPLISSPLAINPPTYPVGGDLPSPSLELSLVGRSSYRPENQRPEPPSRSNPSEVPPPSLPLNSSLLEADRRGRNGHRNRRQELGLVDPPETPRVQAPLLRPGHIRSASPRPDPVYEHRVASTSAVDIPIRREPTPDHLPQMLIPWDIQGRHSPDPLVRAEFHARLAADREVSRANGPIFLAQTYGTTEAPHTGQNYTLGSVSPQALPAPTPDNPARSRHARRSEPSLRSVTYRAAIDSHMRSVRAEGAEANRRYRRQLRELSRDEGGRPMVLGGMEMIRTEAGATIDDSALDVPPSATTPLTEEALASFMGLDQIGTPIKPSPGVREESERIRRLSLLFGGPTSETADRTDAAITSMSHSRPAQYAGVRNSLLPSLAIASQSQKTIEPVLPTEPLEAVSLPVGTGRPETPGPPRSMISESPAGETLGDLAVSDQSVQPASAPELPLSLVANVVLREQDHPGLLADVVAGQEVGVDSQSERVDVSPLPLSRPTTQSGESKGKGKATEPTSDNESSVAHERPRPPNKDKGKAVDRSLAPPSVDPVRQNLEVRMEALTEEMEMYEVRSRAFALSSENTDISEGEGTSSGRTARDMEQERLLRTGRHLQEEFDDLTIRIDLGEALSSGLPTLPGTTNAVVPTDAISLPIVLRADSNVLLPSDLPPSYRPPSSSRTEDDQSNVLHSNRSTGRTSILYSLLQAVSLRSTAPLVAPSDRLMTAAQALRDSQMVPHYTERSAQPRSFDEDMELSDFAGGLEHIETDTIREGSIISSNDSVEAVLTQERQARLLSHGLVRPPINITAPSPLPEGDDTLSDALPIPFDESAFNQTMLFPPIRRSSWSAGEDPEEVMVRSLTPLFQDPPAYQPPMPGAPSSVDYTFEDSIAMVRSAPAIPWVRAPLLRSGPSIQDAVEARRRSWLVAESTGGMTVPGMSRGERMSAILHARPNSLHGPVVRVIRSTPSPEPDEPVSPATATASTPLLQGLPSASSRRSRRPRRSDRLSRKLAEGLDEELDRTHPIPPDAPDRRDSMDPDYLTPSRPAPAPPVEPMHPVIFVNPPRRQNAPQLLPTTHPITVGNELEVRHVQTLTGAAMATLNILRAAFAFFFHRRDSYRPGHEGEV